MQTLGSDIYRLGDSAALTHGGAISGSGEWVQQFQAQINGLQQTKGRIVHNIQGAHDER